MADAELRRGAPRRRSGAARRLSVSRSRQAVLKFRLRDIGSAPVLRARLRVWTASGRSRSVTVRRTRSTRWREGRVSWAKGPRGRGRAVAELRRLRRGRWASATVQRAAVRGGVLSLRLSARGRRAVRIGAREWRKRAPRLELDLGA